MDCPGCGKYNFNFIFEKEGLSLNRCRCCGLVSVDNPDKKFDLRHYEYYKDRLSWPQDELYSRITTKRYADLLKKLEKYRKNNSLLDIGCGEGHFLSVAKGAGWQIRGIELASYAVEVCKRFGINAECVDLLQADLAHEHFDIISMFEVLEHLVQPKQYLSKVNSILRNGGVFLFTTPNFDCLTRRILNKNWSLIHKEHLFYYTSASIRKMVKNAGFKIIGFKIKTITLPEIWSFLRGKGSDKMYICNKAIREAAEENAGLSWLKNLANRFLDLTALGETIECMCQKV